MRRDIAFAAAFLLSATPVLACSCGPKPDPASYRMAAALIFEGEVISIEAAPPDKPGMTKARIRVVRVSKGRAAGSVLIETRNQPEACGYRFAKGEKREFLARRDKAKFVTDSCLMIGAKQ